MDNIALSQGGNLAFTSGALADSATAAKIKTTATITFTINGVFKSKGATDNIVPSYTGASVYRAPTGVGTAEGPFTGGANGSTRLYNVYLDADGNFSVLPGPIVDTAALAAGTAALHFAPPQKDKACIGAMRIAVTAGTTFVPGTTALDATGVTTTYLNLSSVPGEPLRS